MVLDFEISESEWVLLKKNASETERAGSFDEVKRSEVERQAAVSTPGKLLRFFGAVPRTTIAGEIDHVFIEQQFL